MFCPIPTPEFMMLHPIEADWRMLELGNKMNRRGTYKNWFEAIGVDHTSVDLNGRNGALRKDLMLPLELGKFDIVTNFGTTEHVAVQKPAWRNIAEACGRVFVSTTPAPHTFVRHGRWYPTTAFYQEFAALNGFRIERMERFEVGTNKVIIAVRMVRVLDKQFEMPDESLIFDNGNYGVGESNR
jgi:hypothetical protein